MPKGKLDTYSEVNTDGNKAKFQGGNQKHSGVSGKVGVVQKPPKTFGTPKDKGVNK